MWHAPPRRSSRSMARRGLVSREAGGGNSMPYSLAEPAGAHLPGAFGAIDRADGVEETARGL